MKPKILIIAGPNGAGKSTFAREFLPKDAECPAFINADLIAAGLSPFQPEVAAIKAGRLMLDEIAEHTARGSSFAFETTLVGRVYLRMIRDWRRQGYQVKLFFLSLANPEEAIARVQREWLKAVTMCQMMSSVADLLLDCRTFKRFIALK